MKSDYFYSESTKLYVYRQPLKISSRVKKAADKVDLSLKWDDEGRINNIDFNDSKKLLSSLKSKLLSPLEYWLVLSDAKKANDQNMINSLTSNKFCEWLDRVYLKNGFEIDHPKIYNKDYRGNKRIAKYPEGRPGWFNFEGNINLERGVPKKVEIFREKFSTSWKYWSPDFSVTSLDVLAPIRGYVTSVGKPSFDLGIPIDSKQPVQMIRECREKPLEPPIDQKIIDSAYEIIQIYEKLSQNLEKINLYSKCYSDTNKIINFLLKYGKLFQDSKEFNIYELREQFFNVLGLLKVLALKRKDQNKLNKLDEAAKTISQVNYTCKYEEFSNFIISSKSRLKESIDSQKDIIFVMGHKNPDSDTVISSLFEAFRNSIIDKTAEYIPVIQSNTLPEEIKELIGELANKLIFTSDKIYLDAKKTGLTRWISVDQNREPEVQRFFVSIIDHHFVSEVAKNQQIPKTLEFTGSCTSLVTQKIIGMGLYFDKKIATMLYGATLMDTENRVTHKTTYKDKLIMNYIKNISQIKEDNKFYGKLMSKLLNTDDSDRLFNRDYKEDWRFGFAVVKIKGGFDKNGNVLKKKLFKKVIQLAEKNNKNKNFPLTVLKITDYKPDNETVNRERVYLIFNKESSEQFRNSILELMEKIVKLQFKGVNILKTSDFVEFWGTGTQLSRKDTAPILEPIVKVFNEYFYSPSNKLWIYRDFLKYTTDVKKAAKKCKINLSKDSNNRINYITYPEARSLIEELEFSILSLKEYWSALNDAKEINDIQMIKSLQGSNFIEYLDSVILENKYLINHPNIEKEKNKYSINGEKISVKIPRGKPALIHPDEIDPKTGIPNKVRKPNEYGNPDLWRYWEPDTDLVIPVRSYIFLLKQPCWDGKFHINDSFPNLGIRPCCSEPKLPKVKYILNKNILKIRIKKEGDFTDYFWKRKNYNKE